VGTIFARQDDSGSAYTAIAEINSISGPTMTADFIDTTSLDTTGGYRTFIRGFRDGGDVTLEMNFTYAGYEQMKLDFEATASKNYRITLPDTYGTQFDFAGLVTELPLNIVPDDKITTTVKIKVDGQVTVSS